jgi:protein involved in ribonucleotide reduction
MRIVYDTKTGLGKKFAEKLGIDVQPISDAIEEPCILVTRNVGRGMIPGTTKRFLKKYGAFVKGVIVNGDRRFGKYFCAAGPKIASKYGQTIILNIEGEGTDEDVKKVRVYIQKLIGD